MAGRTVLQIDQTAPEDQVLLVNIRKCREDIDIFGHYNLLHGKHNVTKVGHGPNYLRNSTGIGNITSGQKTCKSTV